MIEPSSPSSLSPVQLIRQALRVYQNNFFYLTRIAAIFVVPVAVIHLFILTKPDWQQLVVWIEYSFVAVFANAVLLAAAFHLYVQQPLTLRAVFSRLGRRYGVLLVAGIIQGIAVLVPLFYAGMLIQPLVLGHVFVNNVFTLRGLSSVLSAIIAAVTTIRLYLVPAVALLEQLGPWQTVKQSWNLTRHQWWRILFAVAIGTAISYVITLALAVIPTLIWAERSSTAAQWHYAISVTLLTRLGNVLAWPIQGALTAVLYHVSTMCLLATPSQSKT